MSRKILSKINADDQIIELRMQAEDLINSAEQMNYGDYIKRAKHIEALIDNRIKEIYAEFESNKNI